MIKLMMRGWSAFQFSHLLQKPKVLWPWDHHQKEKKAYSSYYNSRHSEGKAPVWLEEDRVKLLWRYRIIIPGQKLQQPDFRKYFPDLCESSRGPWSIHAGPIKMLTISSIWKLRWFYSPYRTSWPSHWPHQANRWLGSSLWPPESSVSQVVANLLVITKWFCHACKSKPTESTFPPERTKPQNLCTAKFFQVP